MLASIAVPAVVVQRGYWPILGAALVLLSGIADSVDGAIAVVTNRVTRLGYVYDAVADRISEAAWMVAFWLVGVPGWLAVLVGGLAWLHEYIRARATAAGMAEIGVVTLAERSARAIMIMLGLVAAGITGLFAPYLPSGVLTIVAAVAALIGVIGLVQLIGAVQQELTKPQRSRR
jgi:CDP-diacylglycerol--glycerol-3-phosphate 3-phosphatidyltransferase